MADPDGILPFPKGCHRHLIGTSACPKNKRPPRRLSPEWLPPSVPSERESSNHPSRGMQSRGNGPDGHRHCELPRGRHFLATRNEFFLHMPCAFAAFRQRNRRQSQSLELVGQPDREHFQRRALLIVLHCRSE